MNIPVLLEPIAGGFRASTGAPLNLSAEAPTAELALAGIRREIVLKQIAGAQVVELSVPDDMLVSLSRKLAANPFLKDWDEATKAYRSEYEASEAAKDTAAEAAVKERATSGIPEPTPEQQEPAA